MGAVAEVVLKNVTKMYNRDSSAVVDANVHIDDGEFAVLVGPSGCGKSTTLRMVAGLEEITSGQLFIGGKLVNEVMPKDRNVAMVFQNYALYPHMTVYKNMAFGLKIRWTPKDEIERRVTKAATILGIEDLLHRKPKELSGGQRQRVALGRAIVREPQVFLFDEPLSNLDARLRVEMRTELSALQLKLKATTIYVTHDQVEAMTMGSKIIVMNKGRIQQIGSPLTLYNHPKNVFVAGFIGSPPMNIFPVSLARSKKGMQVVGEGITLALSSEEESALGPLGEGELLLGVRPEDLSIQKKESKDNQICGRVNTVEPLGHETHLSLLSKDEKRRFIVTVDPGASCRVGEELTFSAGKGKVHFFDRKTGKNFLTDWKFSQFDRSGCAC